MSRRKLDAVIVFVVTVVLVIAIDSVPVHPVLRGLLLIGLVAVGGVVGRRWWHTG